jgi:hypothetical protein
VRAADVETWVLELVEQLERGARVEDARVELKADWPQAARAARRIAGHANAAHGDSILWVIGVDEHAREVTGARIEELANWWPQVESCFESVAPTLLDLNVPCGENVVVALLFDTSRAPYVVRNREGGAELEVPWREATRVRSARREELLRLLAPAALLPDVEILGAHLERDNRGTSVHRMVAKLYVVPRGRARTCFPFHRAAATVEAGAQVSSALAVSLRTDHGRSPRAAPMILEGPSEVIVDGPGTLFAEAVFPDVPASAEPLREPVRVQVQLRSTDDALPVLLEFTLVPRGARWELQRPEEPAPAT